MQLKEMRRLSDSELIDELKAAKEELFNMRFQLATRQLKDYRALRTARQRIARVLTVNSERGAATNA